MAQSPMVGADGVCVFTVTSGGHPTPDAVPIVSIDISAAGGAPASAQLVIMDGDMPHAAWPVADSHTFTPGAVITVAAGYGAVGGLVFRGVVRSAAISALPEIGARLTVLCEGEALATAADPQLEVTWGRDLQSFEAEITAAGQRGRLAFQGSAAVALGRKIILTGLGARRSGPVTVTALKHHLADGDWRTEAWFGPPR